MSLLDKTVTVEMTSSQLKPKLSSPAEFPSAVLSDKDILEELKKGDAGNVVIDPFTREHLSNCSYDITLGEYFYVENEKSKLVYFCPWNKEHVREYWEDTPQQAAKVTRMQEANRFGVNVGDQVILMAPGATILAHTQEFIGGRRNVTTMMKARSSLGRCCVTICKDAGWGDCNFTNRYTMEIQNCSKCTLVLIVGQKVGQIVFFRTGDILKPYDKDGSYQTISAYDMEALKKAWKPSDMLPKLKRIGNPSENKLPLPFEDSDASSESSSPGSDDLDQAVAKVNTSIVDLGNAITSLETATGYKPLLGSEDESASFLENFTPSPTTTPPPLD